MNTTAWPISVRLRVAAGPRVSISALGPELKPPPLSAAGGDVEWAFELPAYGIVAGVFDQKDVTFELIETKLPDELPVELASKLKEIRQRAAALKEPTPLAAVENAGFESPPTGMEDPREKDDPIPGWLFARGDGIEVEQAAGGYRDSDHALRIVSRGPEVWVRSHALAAPRTGRVAVWVRLRTATPDRQPELRLAIEARRGRQSYYRYANVGAKTQTRLGERWAPFVLQIDDLPRHGLDEFRIGFDLMGAGEVWIDEVEVFDTAFTEAEQLEISRRITAANYYLHPDTLNPAAAASVLDGYWPRFLLEHVDAPQAPAAETPVASPSAPAASQPTSPTPANRETKRSWFRWMPSLF
jgi:hypothetical protein